MTAGASVTAAVDVAVDPVTAFEVFTAEIDAWYQRGPHSWRFPDRAVGIRCEPEAQVRMAHDVRLVRRVHGARG